MAKNKKQTIQQRTPEEQKQINLQHTLNRLIQSKDRYSTPTRTFLVNEEVTPLSARWSNCVVKESYENLFYKIEFQSNHTSRGETTTTTDESWVQWFELGKKDSQISPNLFNERANNINNQFSFSNRELADLVSKKYHFGVNDSPDYQRGLVWELEDKQLLIDSIFKGIEIGKFVFISLDFTDSHSPIYEILDGKQRLNAIIEFIEDRFSYKGFCFSQLQDEDRRYFMRYLATVGESRGELTDKEKYEYFLRLNTRGKEQSLEHLKYVKSLLDK